MPPSSACRRRSLGPLSGVMALIGGLSVALGYKTKWGAWLLIAFLLPVTFTMHAYWRLQDAASIHIQNAMFAKNVAMTGAALLIAYFGSGPVALDKDTSADRRPRV